MPKAILQVLLVITPSAVTSNITQTHKQGHKPLIPCLMGLHSVGQLQHSVSLIALLLSG